MKQYEEIIKQIESKQFSKQNLLYNQKSQIAMVMLQTQALNKIYLFDDLEEKQRNKTKTLSKNCNGLIKDGEL